MIAVGAGLGFLFTSHEKNMWQRWSCKSTQLNCQMPHNVLGKARHYHFSIIHKIKKNTGKHCESFHTRIISSLD